MPLERRRRWRVEIEKSLRLAAEPARVWALLLDPQAMGACVPGMQSIEVISPDEYAAQMHVKLSFISARFKLRTRIVERREPHYLKAEGTGEDTSVASSLKQTTEMFLEAAPDGGTELLLKVKVDLLGRMGTFGLSVMKTKADRMWEEFGINLAARLGIATAGGPVIVAGSAPAPASVPDAPPMPPPVTQTNPVAPLGWWARLLLAIGIQPAGVGVSARAIVVELRRPDQTVVRVEWPATQADECARWLRDTLK